MQYIYKFSTVIRLVLCCRNDLVTVLYQEMHQGQIQKCGYCHTSTLNYYIHMYQTKYKGLNECKSNIVKLIGDAIMSDCF
jgi:hypothetical protein